MKQLGIILVSLFGYTLIDAQVSFETSQTNNNCFGDSNGTVTIENISGCFAPLTLEYDTNTWAFNHLRNDGYNGLNHGAGAGDDQGTGVAAGETSIGDVYIVAGYFEDSIVLDSITLFANAAAGGSGWVAAFDASTNGVIWAHAITGGGSAFCAAYSSEIIGDKAYSVGYFVGSVMFGGTPVVSAGGYQGFIMKTDIPTGEIDTVVQIGNAGTDETTNIQAGDDDRLYVSGDYTGSIQLAGSTLNSSASYDLFITCFDSSLNTNYWAASAGGSSFDIARDVAPHSVNGVVEYVYTTGYYYGSAAFGSTNLTSASGQDIFIAKLDTAGNWIWAESGNGAGTDDAYSIEVSDSGNKLYVGGQFQNTLTYSGQSLTSAGNFDGFIAYLDTSGALTDAYHLAGLGRDGIYDLDLAAEDYLVFAGEFSDTLNFGDSTFQTNGGVGSDCFTGKLGPNLNEIWGKNFGGTSVSTEAFNSVAIGDNEQLHCTGIFSGNASAYQAGLIATGTDAIVTNENITGIVDTTITFSGLPAMDIEILLSDSLGNLSQDTVAITHPDSISLTAVATATTDPTAADGSIDLTPAGGTPGYTYLWSNAEITEDISGLTAGWYIVTVTDSLGCMASDSFYVDSTVVLNLMVTGIVTDKTCQTDNNGAIDITVINGIPPFSYAWSNSSTMEDISSLSPGTYTVTVTDSNSESVSETFTVSDNPIHPDPIVGPISGAASAQWWTNFNYTVPATTGSAFEWSTDSTGEVLSTAANSAIVAWRAGPSGMVYVLETDINGCKGMDSLAVEILPTGTEELFTNEISIFPNPAMHIVNVQLNEEFLGAQVNLFDSDGKRVANAKTLGNTATINVDKLANGIYLVIIDNNREQITKRVVVK